MRKFIFAMVTMFTMCVGAFAQNYATSNYVGSSRFTDNWSISVQAGVLTTVNNFYAGHTALAPIATIGVDKYVNKWLGFGADVRTLIGTGDINVSRFNSKTAFDALNISAYTKFNVLNMFSYSGERKMFEPVIYGGLGWGHAFSGDIPTINTNDGQMVCNSLTGRAGLELNFNIGKKKAWAIVANPSFVWGNLNNMRLQKKNCNFELAAGFVYHFKTSNGTHSFAKAKLYNQSEVNNLRNRIRELENRPAQVVEKIVEVPVAQTEAKPVVDEHTYVVNFAQGSAELTDAAKAVLDNVGSNAIVDVIGTTSPEGPTKVNEKLSVARAQSIANYLTNRGVKVNSSTGGANGRTGIVIVK